jgi:hypothetical protein
MSESPSLKRPRFFSGKLITPEDLELEQQYFLKRLKRHNQTLHGFGIVFGLKVTVNAGQIVVEPGLALDCEGNEVVIGTAQTMVLPLLKADCHTAYVNIRYAEEAADPVPTPGGNEMSTLIETFELDITQQNGNRGHRHLRARWLACGQRHALTIAKLKHSSQGWRVDRGYRAPVIK